MWGEVDDSEEMDCWSITPLPNNRLFRDSLALCFKLFALPFYAGPSGRERWAVANTFKT
jgi:hypothetical protein